MTPGQQRSAPASSTFAADVAQAVADGLAADLDPALPTVVCGHSLGGALATLLVADMAANTPLKPQAWTFASPRVGDAIFAGRYGGLSSVSWRIYNQLDIVPYFPVDASDNYQPVTAGYAINSLRSRALEPRLLPRAEHLPARAVGRHGAVESGLQASRLATSQGAHLRHDRASAASLKSRACVRNDRSAWANPRVAADADRTERRLHVRAVIADRPHSVTKWRSLITSSGKVVPRRRAPARLRQAPGRVLAPPTAQARPGSSGPCLSRDSFRCRGHPAGETHVRVRCAPQQA